MPNQPKPLRLLLMLLLSFVITAPGFAEPQFCWKDSYGRGVGTIPSACPPGAEMIGALCYARCPSGTARFGFDCHSICPAGMRDDGLFCRRPEYGRGTGYSWWWRDGFSNSGMISRCEADYGSNNCEMSGAIAYPKCQPGWHAVGCCICSPDPPNCAQLGLAGEFAGSCAKKVTIGVPGFGTCPPGQERDGGLCYTNCLTGYGGIGPVCWKLPPTGWVDCGMGAAKDSLTCGQIVFGQVAAVGQLAITVVSLGTSMTGGAAANTGALATLQQKYKQLKALYDAAKKANPKLQTAETVLAVGFTAKKSYTALDGAIELKDTADGRPPDAVIAEDFVRVAAQIAAVIDTSGVSATIGAFTYPKCSKYFETQ